MWARYRTWKGWISGALMALAYVLIESEPELSAKWKAGVITLVVLAVGYLAEEFFWIAKRGGRPCERCGRKFRVKPFVLRVRCPRCGHAE